jgi:hypothetical protein
MRGVCPSSVLCSEVVAAPDVVDEDIELADPFEELRDLGRDRVVDPDGDALAAARSHDLLAVRSIVSGRFFMPGLPGTLRPVQ